MKKWIALILALALCLFAACGGKEASAGSSTAPEAPSPSAVTEKESEVPAETPEAPAPSAATEKESEVPVETPPAVSNAPAEEPPAPAETPEAAFDPTWAGRDYEMPIPAPPFAYELDPRSNGMKISSINGGVDGDVTHSNILAYCDTLKAIGFTIDLRENVIGERYGRTCYEFSARHENGNSVELLDDGGGVVIFVYFDI